MADAKTINTRIVLRNDELSAWEKSEKQLLKGEVAFARLSGTNDFEMRIGTGDKTWSELSDSNVVVPDSTKFYEKATFAELEAVVGKNGDIGVVKEEIAAGKYSYTAYRFDKATSGWVALDGNYNAENVYLDSNITITQAFGKHNISSSVGYGEIPCAGWNMKQLIAESFSDTKSAGKTNPSISWASEPGSFGIVEAGTWLTGGNADNAITMKYADGSWTEYNGSTKAGNRVIKSKITATRTALQAEDFNDNIFNLNAINKSYSYNNATDTLSVLEPNTNLTLIGSISNTDLSVQATDSKINLYKWSVTAPYEAGTVTPVNNLGSADEGNKIASGTFTKSETTVTVPAGYRKSFWGYKLATDTLLDFTKLTSTDIRGLQKSSSADRTAPSSPYNVPVGTKQIIFACEGDLKSSLSVKDANALNAPVTFTKLDNAVKVAGANDYNPIDYDIWYCEIGKASGAEKAMSLTLTWA